MPVQQLLGWQVDPKLPQSGVGEIVGVTSLRQIPDVQTKPVQQPLGWQSDPELPQPGVGVLVGVLVGLGVLVGVLEGVGLGLRQMP